MRAATAARLAWPRRLDLRRIVTHDLPLKIAALLIAVLFAIANAQNVQPREITVQFDGRVPVERPDVPTGFVLRGQLGDVSVTLRGPEGVVDHMALTDLHATLDLTGVDASREPRDAKVVVDVAHEGVKVEGVKVVDVTPPTVSVRLERITSRTVAVQTRFANDPPQGSQAGATSVSPKEVRIIGPETAVAQVAAVFATVRFGDVTTDLTQSVPALPVDAAGLPIDGLQVEPGVVVVSVAVLPTATTRTVPVLWTLKGAVAQGYWISQVTTNPIAVTVSGDQQVLAKLEHIDTVAVDVTGFNVTRTLRVALSLPDGVTLVAQTDATVTVTVLPLAGTRPFLIAVQVQDLGAGLVGETDPSTVTVTVAGPAPTLAGLTADQVVAYVSAAGRGPGSSPADVSVRLPQGVTLQSVQPIRVTLTMRAR